ncbi:MAG: helicase HerA-like domain-containing protein [Cuniculiplasma sp.]
MQESDSEIGYITGQSESEYFQFVISPESNLRRWEYITVRQNNRNIIGRVEKLLSFSDIMSQNIDYETVKKLHTTKIREIVDVAKARSIGSITGDGRVLKSNRELIRPGTPVRRSTEEEMRQLFGYDEEGHLELGTLTDYENVKTGISINGLRRHVAIMAQTGAGKSNTAAVLIEELAKAGATIVVLDPHADYSLMKASPSMANITKVFKTPMSTGRYGKELNSITERFSLRFQDLEEDDLFNIMRIDEQWTNMREIVRKLHSNIKGKGDFDDFMRAYESMPLNDKAKIAGRVALLKAVRDIFTDVTTPVTSYMRAGQLSILDLSGLDQDIISYFCLKVLDEIYDQKTSGNFKYPVFFFIEEAHNFVGRETVGKLPVLIKKIASEGRKFGTFLVVITQRPGKIDQDVLSQCNSQIILRVTNPMDQKAIEESCESVSESIINDLPSLNTGEAVLVGEFVRFPVIIKVRRRETREGGGDIDIIPLMKESILLREKASSPEKNRDFIGGLI